jgi:DNA polymerase-3 subunit gamma/tau
VGKTSMARIFAKALNAVPELEQSEQIAEAILRGDDLDVIEIDGASNRGIQEAKDLIAGAGLSPARCPYKIYIIDEVHMLTREAFNALLKTMEEPPRHVKFILCTTDPHKVPATIQSRCQRFDFRTIPTSLIAEQLRSILDQEGIEADDALVTKVARLGNGSMRDALSLLDRLIAAGAKTLTLELAEQTLGLPDQSLAATIVEAVTAADPKAALEAGAELLARGATVEQALEMLAEHLRMLMLIQACGEDSELVELSQEETQTAKRQAEAFDVAGLVHMIAVCDAAARNARSSAAARALFDAALVRLCLSERFADIGALLRGDGQTTSTAPATSGRKKKDDRLRPASAPSPDVHATPRPALSPAIIEPKPPDSHAAAPVGDQELWTRVVDAASGSPKDHAKVRDLRLERFDGQTLRLTVSEAAADRARYLSTQTEGVAALVKRLTGRHVRVKINPPRNQPAAAAANRQADFDEIRQLPVVREATEIFDAVVTDVRDDDVITPPADQCGERTS